MRCRGFTLLELTVAISLLTVVCGMLFMLALSMARAANVQEAKITSVDDARTAMMFVIRNIRQASDASLALGALPGPSLTFQAATDLDGNGTAVDSGVNLELSQPRTLMRDTADANADGLTDTQLVMVEGANVRVIVNGLLPNEDADGDGLLSAGEDHNFNGRLDRGLWFERAGRGIRVTIQAERSAGPDGPMIVSDLVETVVPRN